MKVGSIASATFGLIPVQPIIAPIDAVPAIVKHVEIAIPKSNQFINSNFAYTPRTRYYDAIASDPRIRIVVGCSIFATSARHFQPIILSSFVGLAFELSIGS